MHFENPQQSLWFLDADPIKSAQCLSTKYLELGIRNIIQHMMCVIYYYVGIRNSRIFEYHFGNKDKYVDSCNAYFGSYYPIKCRKLSFAKYGSVQSKWMRKCNEHFQFSLQYLNAMLSEYEIRKGSQHKYSDMLAFFINIQTLVKIPDGKIKQIVFPWKCIPLKYRKKDIIESYRKIYKLSIIDPFIEYQDTKNDIPDWILKDFVLQTPMIQL